MRDEEKEKASAQKMKEFFETNKSDHSEAIISEDNNTSLNNKSNNFNHFQSNQNQNQNNNAPIQKIPTLILKKVISLKIQLKLEINQVKLR